jgi:F-type H+-transporting ATPase subunit gamma
MASLKVLRRRIRSVTSTQQITKAMAMVAAAKLRRAQARAQSTRPYAVRLTGMLERVVAVARERELTDPVLGAGPAAGGGAGVTLLVVVTSDRGLCGGFNTTLFRAVEERLRVAAPGSLRLVVVGRKGRDYAASRGWPVDAVFPDVGPDANVAFARRVTADVMGRFRGAHAGGTHAKRGSGEVARVELLYTHFLSALRRTVTHETFLPIGADGGGPAGAGAPAPVPAGDVLLEPGLEPILEELLPRFAVARMLAALADSRASEEGARMTAMGAASKNAGELLDQLVLERNRLRQTMITREILDIVGGAEALT